MVMNPLSEKRRGEALSVGSSWGQRERETGRPRWSCAFETQNPVSEKEEQRSTVCKKELESALS